MDKISVAYELILKMPSLMEKGHHPWITRFIENHGIQPLNVGLDIYFVSLNENRIFFCLCIGLSVHIENKIVIMMG